MTVFRRCPNCKQLYKGRRCVPCAAKYDKKRMTDIESMKIYSKARWKACRRDVRLQYNDYDIWLLAVGRVVVCDSPVVHHIIERDVRPDLCYDLDNLITVSRDSHAEIHEAYKKNMRAALARIEEGKRRYGEMMKK